MRFALLPEPTVPLYDLSHTPPEWFGPYTSPVTFTAFCDVRGGWRTIRLRRVWSLKAGDKMVVYHKGDKRCVGNLTIRMVPHEEEVHAEGARA